MNTLNSLKNQVFWVSVLAFSVLFTGSPCVYAQSSLEGGKIRFAAASEEVNVSGVKKPAENNYSDEKIHEIVKSFFAMLFEKNYEGAAVFMENRQKPEKTIAAMEKWRERFMAPSDVKILNRKNNTDGSATAVVTFQYKNANGVSDIMREKVTLFNSAAELKIRNLDSLDAIIKPASKTVSGTVNTVSVSTSQPDNSGASSAITSLLSGNTGSQSGGAPNITSLISAIGSGNGGAANIDPGELLGLMTDMANDPDVLALATNPKIMAIAKDPSIMSTLMSGNAAAAEADPRIKELLSDPGVQKIIEKMKNKKSGGSSGSSIESTPSSVSDSQMDKIFE